MEGAGTPAVRQRMHCVLVGVRRHVAGITCNKPSRRGHQPCTCIKLPYQKARSALSPFELLLLAHTHGCTLLLSMRTKRDGHRCPDEFVHAHLLEVRHRVLSSYRTGMLGGGGGGGGGAHTLEVRHKLLSSSRPP